MRKVTKIEEKDLKIENRPIGRGGNGAVYKGVWNTEVVAVKNFSVSEKSSFKEEVDALLRVDHKNIIKLFGISTHFGNDAIVIEFLPKTLHNELHENLFRYSITNVLSWAKQCADGVAYLHALKPEPLAHRDLKPLNLLLTDMRRTLKICDFGTSKHANELQTFVGTLCWMAPEVGQDQTPVYSEKCDVYSFGIILWEMLTRKVPFYDLQANIVGLVRQGRRPPLIMGCPNIVERLMVDCWDADPNKRPSMADVVKRLDAMSFIFNYLQE